MPDDVVGVFVVGDGDDVVEEDDGAMLSGGMVVGGMVVVTNEAVVEVGAEVDVVTCAATDVAYLPQPVSANAKAKPMAAPRAAVPEPATK